MVGQEIGSYTLKTKIGEGGMGEVYVAEHKLLRRKAAVKLLLKEFAGDENIVKRFINEAKATSQIVHPGVVRIYDFGKTPEGSTYIVMEFLDGETLYARVRKEKRLPVPQAIAIVKQMAEALSVAHAQRVIHRDLKPENVFLVKEEGAPFGERVKILDFGIAKMLDPAAGGAHTKTGSILGTPVYMSPEQCQAKPNIDHRADEYALGCVFFHLLCGRPPFDQSGIGELLGAHVYTTPATPSSLVPEIPAAIDAVVLKLLKKQPDERYASMADLVTALDEATKPRAEPAAAPEVERQTAAPSEATVKLDDEGIEAQRKAIMAANAAYAAGAVGAGGATGRAGSGMAETAGDGMTGSRAGVKASNVEVNLGTEATTALPSGAASLLSTGPGTASTGLGPAGSNDATVLHGAAPSPNELATMIASGKARAQIVPPQSSAGAAGEPAPVRSSDPERKPPITTLGGAAGESTRGPLIPQPEKRKTSSLTAMAIAFGLTIVLALGGFFLFGRSSGGGGGSASHGAPVGGVVTITIESEPPGAEVYRDGALLGVTPYELKQSPIAGELTLTLRKAGYDEAKLAVAGDKDAKKLITLLQHGGTKP
jgi:eukaryotic-like serine/threonine-protein kinase